MSRHAIAVTLIALVASAASAQEGEWIELDALRPAQESEAPAPAAVMAEPESAEPIGAPVEVVTVYTDLDADPEAAAAPGMPAEAPPEEPPALDLPRRFHWQGETAPLGRVGYVYLGDYYFVEERDFARAETCWLYALEPWPECGPLQTRLELLSLFTGDWLRTAESLQVGFEDGPPPRVMQDYGIDADSPLLSSRLADVPPVPAMHFRLALARAKQLDVEPAYAPARDFLVGRLLAYLGEPDAAIRTLGPVALAEDAAPWNFQAASQRAALLLATWRPELAYVNLLRAQELVGEHPVLMERLTALREEMTLLADPGEGEPARAVVRILSRQEQGRWILSAPEHGFAGRVQVQAGDADLEPHLLYRGDDYWVMTMPLGSAAPDWAEGAQVTLLGKR